ncbi:hypothetical protein GPALN_006574 [Globodera pallida]|nr:hypothetical protein GPALN_006574 [Globodera pallida]
MSTPGTKQNSVESSGRPTKRQKCPKQMAKGSKVRTEQANKSNTIGSQSEKRKEAAKKELRHLIDYFPTAGNRMTRSRRVPTKQMAIKTVEKAVFKVVDGRWPTKEEIATALNKGASIITFAQLRKPTPAIAQQNVTPMQPNQQQHPKVDPNNHPTLSTVQHISEEGVEMEQIQFNNHEQIEEDEDNLVDPNNHPTFSTANRISDERMEMEQIQFNFDEQIEEDEDDLVEPNNHPTLSTVHRISEEGVEMEQIQFNNHEQIEEDEDNLVVEQQSPGAFTQSQIATLETTAAQYANGQSSSGCSAQMVRVPHTDFNGVQNIPQQIFGPSQNNNKGGHVKKRKQVPSLRGPIVQNEEVTNQDVRLWVSGETDAVPGRRTKSYGHGPFRAEPTQDLLAAGVYTLGTPEDDIRRMSSLQ